MEKLGVLDIHGSESVSWVALVAVGQDGSPKSSWFLTPTTR